MAAEPSEPNPAPVRRRGAATTRSTAGPGFDFEDDVGAWFLSKALCGQPIDGIGALVMVQFQTGALGWLIDDMLLTGGNPAQPRRLAVSCKSNQQVSSAGWPADFITAAWTLWRQGPMSAASDTLALVSRGRVLEFDTPWTEIATDCGGADPSLAIARIRQTPARARVFDSMRRPGGADLGGSDEAAVALVPHLQTIPLDFQLTGSTALSDGVARCRTLLVSNDQIEAQALWRRLVELVHAARVGAGTLTVAQVWSALRRQFELKDLPDYDGAWRRLRDITSDRLALIETTLPSGLHLPREREVLALGDLVQAQPATVVFGESGAGKSALVKSTLDQRFASFRQVWLGPDELGAALGAATRAALGLTRPLDETLAASASADNVLVLDSAERIPTERLQLVRQLLDALAPSSEVTGSRGWRVVLVTQTEGWGARSSAVLGQRALRPYDVAGLAPGDVRLALRSTIDLGWLADNPNAVLALANPKTLAWVMDAGGLAPAADRMTSPAVVADHIWAHWTDGDVPTQGLLTRLAVREADFERSFAVSELNPADAQTYQSAKDRIPLRRGNNNRLEFAHDLASDLARFQRLREIGGDMAAWAPFASNPLWHSALRTFGQWLLRERVGGDCQWDVALAQAEGAGLTSVVDLLLDALCLDPEAEIFLTERTTALLAADGRLLVRLLGRFLHVATVPSAFGILAGANSLTNLYLQATVRVPIVGRWPAVARFLDGQLDAVAALTSPTVAAVCQLWLTRTPAELPEGQQVPFRREFAEIALASSRAMQVIKGRGDIVMGESVKTLDAATLSGAGDLPDPVANWVLEMSRRRPLDTGIAAEIAAEHKRKVAERRAQEAANPQPRPARSRAPVSISSRRSLPPWPLGAQGRIDHDFREAACQPSGLAPLMRVRPAQAAEALLALVIHDAPSEDWSSSPRWDEDLGLAYSHQAYPTAFWKSPFYAFLQIAPEPALAALIQLIEFCTERWLADWRHHHRDSAPLSVAMTLANGQHKTFFGGWKVFDWTEVSSTHNGHLHCALSALERCLVDQIEAGGDPAWAIEALLDETTSLAIVGLLVNIAKLRPALLMSTLTPLLSVPELFELDANRVENGAHGGALTSWAQESELVFEAAKTWIFAPHRQLLYRDIVGLALAQSPAAAQIAATAAAALPAGDAGAAKLRRDILRARLDASNYKPVVNPETGETDFPFEPPEALLADIAAHDAALAPQWQSTMLAPKLQRVLNGQLALNEADLPILAGFLDRPADGQDLELAADNALGAAATLAAFGDRWMADNSELAERVKRLLRQGALAIADDAAGVRSERVGLASRQLPFIAHGVMWLWLHSGLDATWEPLILRVMTSGNRDAAQVIGHVAYEQRARLGPIWWRLLQLALLWSALSMLAPGYESEEPRADRWERWLAQFRRLQIAGVAASLESIAPILLAERLSRIEADNRRRRDAARGHSMRRSDQPRLASLQTDDLRAFLGWLVKSGAFPPADLAMARSLLFRFCDYEIRWCSDHAEDSGTFHLPYQFGFEVIERMAALAGQDPEGGADAWRKILALGPLARPLIDHFLTHWFFVTAEDHLFGQRWREMIAFALDQTWEGGSWYYGQRILRQLMGFGAASQLAKRDNGIAMVASMEDLYSTWAERHLAADEDNIAAFANFLDTPVGRPLRLMGVARLIEMLGSPMGARQWTRDGAGPAVLGFLDTLLTEDLAAVAQDPATRDGVLRLAAALVGHKVPAALSLQERAAQLFK
jgi:hypothetical protein